MLTFITFSVRIYKGKKQHYGHRLMFALHQVEIRENLAIPKAQWPQAISELYAIKRIEQVAVLVTCI